MCGRFAGFSTLDEIRAHFSVETDPPEAVRSNYNVAPSQQVLSVVEDGGERRLVFLHWGLVPFWAKDRTIGSRMINARSETVDQKPSFKAPFQKRRCLVVNDGFFEWARVDGKKQPVFIRPRNESGPFGFAGLWEVWRARDEPETAPHRSCTILTAEAADSIKAVHHRMPVVLKPEAYRQWLDASVTGPEVLRRLLRDHCHRDFEYRPVSRKVNSPANNEPDLIEAVRGSEP
jgi:putative SOS response-associated peptidase YedK